MLFGVALARGVRDDLRRKERSRLASSYCHCAKSPSQSVYLFHHDLFPKAGSRLGRKAALAATTRTALEEDAKESKSLARHPYQRSRRVSAWSALAASVGVKADTR